MQRQKNISVAQKLILFLISIYFIKIYGEKIKMEVIIVAIVILVLISVIAAATSSRKELHHDDLIDDDEMFIEDSKWDD